MLKQFSLADIHAAAYLTLHGLTFTFDKKGTKVFFCFEAVPEVYEKVEEFNIGALVDVAAYSKELRKLRALMYTEKGL